MTELIADRDRALSFGDVAEAYERSRPSYPPALVDDLVALHPRDVLDVGAGTGKAGRLLVARGLTVSGVEPDPRMAAVARSQGYPVEEATFESWEPHGRTFDLIVAGQSWHWVDPDAGPRKAAAVLRPSGHLAAFWNLNTLDDAMRTALEPVYRRIAPEIAATTTALGVRDNRDAERGQRIADIGAFTAVEVRSYAWSKRYSRDEWLDFLGTHSDHLLLDAGRRAALLAAVGETVERLGGAVHADYQTILILARRSAR